MLTINKGQNFITELTNSYCTDIFAFSLILTYYLDKWGDQITWYILGEVSLFRRLGKGQPCGTSLIWLAWGSSANPGPVGDKFPQHELLSKVGHFWEWKGAILIIISKQQA